MDTATERLVCPEDVQLRADLEHDTVRFQARTKTSCERCGVPLALGYQSSPLSMPDFYLAGPEAMLRAAFAERAELAFRRELAGPRLCECCQEAGQKGSD